jgi:MoaA/NifB/PqqE/SkfB family radical SAM enzyme
MGSFKYSRDVTIPECGVCMDLLHRLAIDRFGNISCCVRFDPSGCGILGNINEESIDEIWNGRTRAKIIENHLRGNRDFWKICSTCDFFGLPTPW